MCDEGTDKSGGSGDLRPPINPQEYARSHPLRIAILALLAKRERTVAGLDAELPGVNSPARIKYHLGVLQHVGLVNQGTGEANPTYRLA